MTNSYDDKIKKDIHRRKQRASQRRAQRDQELRKQYALIAGTTVVLLLFVIIAFKGCDGCIGCGSKEEETTTTTEVTTTTTTFNTLATDEVFNDNDTSFKAFTKDRLNFRTSPEIPEQGERSNVQDVIEMNEKVEVYEILEDGIWCKIKYHNKRGYVMIEFLERIEEETSQDSEIPEDDETLEDSEMPEDDETSEDNE